MPQVGIRGTNTWFGRNWWGGAENWYTSLKAGLEYSDRDSGDGLFQNTVRGVYGGFNAAAQSNIFLGAGERDFVYSGVPFDQQYVFLFGGLQPNRTFGFRINLNHNKNAADFTTLRAGTQLRLSPSVNFAIGKHLRGNLSHNRTDFKVDEGTLFDASITELRMRYQMNLRTFVRIIVQASESYRNQSLHSTEVTEHTDDLFGQLLFSYKINPQTAAYFGYTSDHVDRTRTGLRQTGETLFFKLSYAWQPN